MSLVWQNATDLQGNDLIVMLALADWSNDIGRCWPSVPALADKARVSERTVRYVLHRLVDLRYVAVEEQRGRNHTNQYLLNLQVLGLDKVQPLQVIEPENLQSTTQNLQPQVIKPAIAIAPKPLEPLIEPSLKKDAASTPHRTPIQTSYPDNFEVTEEMRLKARAKYPDLDIDAATEEWAGAMCSNRTKYRYTDWQQAWLGAMRRANEWGTSAKGNINGRHKSTSGRGEAAVRVFQELTREAELLSEEPHSSRRLGSG